MACQETLPGFVRFAFPEIEHCPRYQEIREFAKLPNLRQEVSDEWSVRMQKGWEKQPGTLASFDRQRQRLFVDLQPGCDDGIFRGGPWPRLSGAELLVELFVVLF